MKNKQREEYKINNKKFQTFPEAVSFAYMEKAKLGAEWDIVSVARLYDVS